MQFSELKLSQSLQKSVQAMGYDEATPIQVQAIPPALAGRDIIGCA
jgi:superfamily II DNA/RNA helicase